MKDAPPVPPRSTPLPGRALAVAIVLALCAAETPATGRAPGEDANGPPPLAFRDDLGAPVSGLEVCFQVQGARRCPEVDPAAGVRWPADATALWAAGPGHGPVWIEREAPGGGTVGPEVVVPRKAELTVDDVPAGASLAFYRTGDRAFTVPLDRFRVLDPARRILAPPGATVLAIRDRDGAPDLHRLDAPPGGAVRVRYTPRTGWSAVLRASAWIDRSPLPGTTMRWIESSTTAPRARRSELAALETGGDGLVLLSGIEAAMTTAEVARADRAPVTVHGLVAPPGGLLYQEVALRPGGTVAARVLWRGEPAAGWRVALVARPTDPDRRVTPSEVVFRGRLGDDGRVRIEQVPVGRYLLRVRAPGGSGLSSHADLVLRVDDGRVAEVAADFHPRTVRGRVARGGEGAAGYRLHARVVRAVTEPGDDGRRRTVTARTAQGTVVTGEDGRYELTLLADGVYLLALHAADGTPIASRYVQLHGGDAEASFRLASETLRGRVVSSRGGVVGGAEVWVRWGDRQIQRASTRPDGRFDFPFEADRVSTGPVVAGAIKDGWLGDEREVAIGDLGAPRFERIERGRREGDGTVRVSGPEIDEPAHPEEIGLTLQPLGHVRGRVVDGDGRPIPGAWVASCRDREGSPLRFVGSARTSGDGAFEVPSGVADGAPPPQRAPVRLYVSAPGCPLTETLVEPPGPLGPPGGRLDEEDEPPPVTIRCDTPPAVLRAHLAFSRSHSLPGERITLRRNGRVLPPQLLAGHLDQLGLPRTTGEDGSILLVLAPGRWQLYLARGASATAIAAGDESDLLGTVALDPWTVTHVALGAGDD